MTRPLPGGVWIYTDTATGVATLWLQRGVEVEQLEIDEIQICELLEDAVRAMRAKAQIRVRAAEAAKVGKPD